MHLNKKIIATFCLLSVVVFAASASMEPEHETFKNLKVLPKNISHDDLHKVMDEWKDALGVKCNFCHVRNEEAKKMDFVSDAKPEKAAARYMFKMTARINKKFFHGEKGPNGMMMETGINCNTCHRGTEHPPETMEGHHEHDGDKKD